MRNRRKNRYTKRERENRIDWIRAKLIKAKKSSFTKINWEEILALSKKYINAESKFQINAF